MAANKILYRGFGTNKPGGIANNFMDLRLILSFVQHCKLQYRPFVCY